MSDRREPAATLALNRRDAVPVRARFARDRQFWDTLGSFRNHREGRSLGRGTGTPALADALRDRTGKSPARGRRCTDGCVLRSGATDGPEVGDAVAGEPLDFGNALRMDDHFDSRDLDWPIEAVRHRCPLGIWRVIGVVRSPGT